MGIANQLTKCRDEMERAGAGLIVVVSDERELASFERLADQIGVPYINLSRELAQRLLDLPKAAQARRTPREIDITMRTVSGSVAVGRLGLLHLPELQLDPVAALQRMARSRVVIAEWNGYHKGSTLIYAEPGHSEYRTWSDCRFPILSQSDLSG